MTILSITDSIWSASYRPLSSRCSTDRARLIQFADDHSLVHLREFAMDCECLFRTELSSCYNIATSKVQSCSYPVPNRSIVHHVESQLELRAQEWNLDSTRGLALISVYIQVVTLEASVALNFPPSLQKPRKAL